MFGIAAIVVAAANALSDVYAMGGTPLTALALAAFPDGRLPLSVLSEILRGGEDVVRSAGALVVGGHTVNDDEVKYGLAVTGTVHPDRILSNAAARPGDVLILTKALGTGVLATKMKSGTLQPEHAAALLTSMVRLNADASREAVNAGVRAATDITGFGLLGHALHMARASGVTLRFEGAALPALPGAMEAIAEGVTTGAKAGRPSMLQGRQGLTTLGSTSFTACPASHTICGSRPWRPHSGSTSSTCPVTS